MSIIRTRQTFTVDFTITVNGEYERAADHLYAAVDAMREMGGVVSVDHDITYRGPSETLTLPEPNRDALIALAQWAAAEHAKKELGLPSEWDQSQWLRKGVHVPGDGWTCGTSACLAGKTVLDAGWLPAFGEFYGDGESTGMIVRVDEDGEEITRSHAEEEAQKILGLNSRQAGALFSGDNDLARVLEVISNLLNNPEYLASDY